MKEEIKTLKQTLELASCYINTAEAWGAVQALELRLANLEECCRAQDRTLNFSPKLGGFSFYL